MDFYNLQETDHKLFSEALRSMTPECSRASATASECRDLLKKYFFNLDRVTGKKNILVVEEDPRLQRVMRSLVMDSAAEGAQCQVVDSLDKLEDLLKNQVCDLLVANYYQSEDEIEYEFWERTRARFPNMEVIIFSHVNDREYYEMLERLSEPEDPAPKHPMTAKLKSFFENVFGG